MDPHQPCSRPCLFAAESRAAPSLKENLHHAPSGKCVCWGMPFNIGPRLGAALDAPVTLSFDAVRAPWLVFMHATDVLGLPRRADGVHHPARGCGVVVCDVGGQREFTALPLGNAPPGGLAFAQGSGLDQIEGSLAYLDTLATRAETKTWKRMRLALTAAHRTLHNRIHAQGRYHQHGPAEDHAEHH